MRDVTEIDFHLIPDKQIYYKEDTSYGIYSCRVDNSSPTKIMDKETGFYDETISIVGFMPQLNVGALYIGVLVETNNPKYGKQYQVKSIYKKPLSNREEQITFLKSILTEKQVDSLENAYPFGNLVELILDGKIETEKTFGIGEATLEKIKFKVAEYEIHQKAIVVLTGEYGIPYAKVKRLSEKYGSPDLLLQKIEKNPYILTEVSGFGFKKVDEIALMMGVSKRSINRIEACIIYLLNEQANDGHCWVKRTKIINEAIKLLGLKISDISEAMDELIEGDRCEFQIDDSIIYLKKTYETEKKLSHHIRRLLEVSPDVTESETSKIEQYIKEAEDVQGFTFTVEQRQAILYAVKYNFVVINGKAGTGKTSVIKGIIYVLNKVDEDLSIATCALSGKASQRIKESTGKESFTIHRLLKLGSKDDEYNDNSHNESHPLTQDVVFLDEGSMVNSSLFYLLIRAIKDGGKLIISGDTAQLEPIGYGNTLVDLLESVVPKVELTIVHRQAQKSGILSCANMVRDGLQFFGKNDYATQRLGELKDLFMNPKSSDEKLFSSVVKLAKKYKGDIMDFQILTPMKNKGLLCSSNLNTELQVIFNKNPEEVDDRRKLTIGDRTFLQGDKVIINQGNDVEKGTFNGTMGTIEEIDTTRKTPVVIDFEGVGLIAMSKGEMENIELGYAISTHKSQGSQWKHVVFILSYSSYVLLNRQLTYTGMTRASESLFMFVEPDALQHAINTDKSSKRNTFLKDFLSA